MSKNKIALQENNTNLETIKSLINSLPDYEDVTPEAMAVGDNNTDLRGIKQTIRNLPQYENLTDVLNTQDGIITSISEALSGKLQPADATAADILEGKHAYVGKELLTGTYDPATADPDLIPENIREGVDIFGIIGSLGEGRKVDSGTFTLAYPDYGSTSWKIVQSVSHTLGTVPSIVFVTINGNVPNNSNGFATYWLYIGGTLYSNVVYYSNYYIKSQQYDTASSPYLKVDTFDIALAPYGSGLSRAAMKYAWVAIS